MEEVSVHDGGAPGGREAACRPAQRSCYRIAEESGDGAGRGAGREAQWRCPLRCRKDELPPDASLQGSVLEIGAAPNMKMCKLLGRLGISPGMCKAHAGAGSADRAAPEELHADGAEGAGGDSKQVDGEERGSAAVPVELMSTTEASSSSRDSSDTAPLSNSTCPHNAQQQRPEHVDAVPSSVAVGTVADADGAGARAAEIRPALVPHRSDDGAEGNPSPVPARRADAPSGAFASFNSFDARHADRPATGGRATDAAPSELSVVNDSVPEAEAGGRHSVRFADGCAGRVDG